MRTVKRIASGEGIDFWQMGDKVARAPAGAELDAYGEPMGCRWECSLNHWLHFRQNLDWAVDLEGGAGMQIIGLVSLIAAVILFFCIISIATQMRRQTDLLKDIRDALRDAKSEGHNVTWLQDGPLDPEDHPKKIKLDQ